MRTSAFRNSGAQRLSDFEPYHNQRLAQFLPCFYPILEGKLCRGKKEGKNGVNLLYPGVKRPIFY